MQMSWRARSLFAVASIVCFAGAEALAQGQIYWTEIGEIETRIRRSNLDGTGVQTILFRPISGGGNADIVFPTSIALDQANQHMYWVDFSRDRISRASFNGQNITPLVQLPSTANLRAVAIDVPNNQMFFTNFTDDTINRANLDGTGQSIVLDLPAASIPLGLALDPAGYIYFTDNGTNAIRRVKQDGTDLVDLVTSSSGVIDSPVNVQLDLANEKMYWVDFGSTASNTGRIERANLDGTGRELLIGNLPLPEDLALDLLAGKMYWTDGIADQIRSANLDGTGQQVVVSGSNMDFPFALALDVPVPEPTSLSIIGIAAAFAMRRRRAI